MKDIVYHASTGERMLFLMSRFKTKEFQESQVIIDLCRKASQKRLFFFEYTDGALEWGHFSTWWNGIAMRSGSYLNDTINDLYWAHELFHAAHKTIGFQSERHWAENKIAEEFEASLFSEQLIYLLIPGIREKSFPFTIFFDEVGSGVPESHRRARRTYGQYVGISKVVPSHATPAQKLIIGYANGNVAWTKLWLDSGLVKHIEVAMSLLENGDPAKDERPSIERHLAWLKHYSTKNIPFFEQAVEFSRTSKALGEMSRPVRKVLNLLDQKVVDLLDQMVQSDRDRFTNTERIKILGLVREITESSR